MSVTLNRARHPKLKRTLRSIARNWDLYLLLVPGLVLMGICALYRAYASFLSSRTLPGAR